MDRDGLRDLLQSTLTDAGVEVSGAGDDRWLAVLAGEWKRTIPVLLHLDERHLHVTSLLAGRPDEGHEEVYRILLQRNARPAPVHFALDDDGNIILSGRLPLVACDAESVDQLLGAVVSTSDEVFNRVLRAGFASYIEAEQRWRKANDLPPNPVSSSP